MKEDYALPLRPHTGNPFRGSMSSGPELFRDYESLQEEIIQLKKARNEQDQLVIDLKTLLARKDAQMKHLSTNTISELQVLDCHKKTSNAGTLKPIPALKRDPMEKALKKLKVVCSGCSAS